LPAIGKVFPNVENNLLHTIARLQETNTIYEQTILSTKEKLFQQRGGELQVPVLRLKKLQPQTTWLWELFKDFDCSPAQLPELVKLLDADNGSFLDTTSHRFIKNRKWLIITTNTTAVHSTISITEEDKKISFSSGELLIEKINNDEHFKISKEPSIAMIDAATIKFPLLLRKLKQGDYFYPLGMQKKKKISRFMIDQKFSKTEKENTWVIESNKKIVWIAGHRIDDRFKITPKTKIVLKLWIH
jgi:tRNA(Ile)-lysidine synthase